MAEEKATEDASPESKKGKAVTGRPNDLPIVTHKPALANSTLGSRAKARVTQDKVVKPEDVETK